METRPVPEIGPDDVLIKIHKTGICGTDIHAWNWDARREDRPRPLYRPDSPGSLELGRTSRPPSASAVPARAT
jgi:threonine dehydrogenase-like Zn-dependent dehydrogenase